MKASNSLFSALFLALGLLLLGALFLLFRPEPPISEAYRTAPPAPAVPTPVEFVIAGGQRVSGPAVVSVIQGDVVRLLVKSDRDDELHLHGYELSLALQAGQSARLDFEATRSGRFELELHHSHLDLTVLEVRPR